MKRLAATFLAVILGAALNIPAQDISFSDLYNGYVPDKAASSPAAEPAAPAPEPAPQPAEAGTGEKQNYKWLVMVFINARNNLWRAGIMDVNEMEEVGSTDKVAVVAELGLLQDRGNSTRFFIQKDTDTSKITSPGRIMEGSDMGSWKYFVDFAKWAIKKYPAEKHMLILWNHGTGRLDMGGADNSSAELGIAYDDLTRNFIRNSQLARALMEISKYAGKKVEVYASDACLMQMLSVVYETGNWAQTLVQSEEIVPGAGFPYDQILEKLNSNPGASAAGAAKIITEEFDRFYEAAKGFMLNASQGTTISAIDTAKVDAVISSLNGWIGEALKADRKKLLAAVDETFSFEYGYNGHDTSMHARSKDLRDFIDRVGAKIGEDEAPRLHALGENLKKKIGEAVISREFTGPNAAYSRAGGLAVYFPKLIYDTSYDEAISSRDSLWDDFVKWILDENYGIGQ